MHVVVLRRDVYERDRWIAMNLFRRSRRRRALSQARPTEIGISALPMPWLPDHARRWREVAGEDFWPYGIEPNRRTLEAFLQYAHEQGVCPRPLKIEELSRRRRSSARRSSRCLQSALMPTSLISLPKRS